jgi:predicted amidohydrolase YtcJ
MTRFLSLAAAAALIACVVSIDRSARAVALHPIAAPIPTDRSAKPSAERSAEPTPDSTSTDRSAKASASAEAAADRSAERSVSAAQSAVTPADLVLRNGKIVTVDEGKPEAQALAARGDTIVAVGSNQEIQPYIGAATNVIDLKGALATPGFIDAHVHFTGVGDAAKNLKLATAKNWDEIVRMVGEAARTARPGEWILGRGWHQEKWSDVPSPNVEGFPLHDALSKAAPNNPVWLTHASGHAGFANAVAMKMAEVAKTTPDPDGGKILRDKDGNATGLFNERAQSIVAGALSRDLATRTPAKVEADLREVIELAAREALAKGLTTVNDAGSPPLTIEVMKKVVDEGKLPLRVWMMLREDARNLAADMPKYRVVNYGDKRFTVRATKRAIDGALGSRGAWMLEPYADLATTSGLTTDNLDDVRMIAELAIKNDYQMAIHAIGDRGNREVLNIYEDTFRRHPEKNSRDLRWRIEHAQHLNAADIARFGRLGVIASMQGIHATSDAVFVLARLGPRRAEEGAYVWQKLMKSGATIANGTDAPVEDIDPIPSFYASVSRKVKDGSVFYGDQRMSRMEALRSYTINAAFAGFDESIKGSLGASKLADITVFSTDLMTVPEDQIPATTILYTIVGGKVQYQGGSAPASAAGRP